MTTSVWRGCTSYTNPRTSSYGTILLSIFTCFKSSRPNPNICIFTFGAIVSSTAGHWTCPHSHNHPYGSFSRSFSKGDRIHMGLSCLVWIRYCTANLNILQFNSGKHLASHTWKISISHICLVRPVVCPRPSIGRSCSFFIWAWKKILLMSLIISICPLLTVADVEKIVLTVSRGRVAANKSFLLWVLISLVINRERNLRMSLSPLLMSIHLELVGDRSVVCKY